MPEQFLHGVQVVESEDGVRSIRTVRSSVIGIVGTAPDADETEFPLNIPVLVTGSRAKAALLDTTGDGKGTLPSALDAILDQIGALIIVIRVEEGSSSEETLANIMGGVDSNNGSYIGVHALLGAETKVGFRPRILCVPEYSADSGVLTEVEAIAQKLRAIVIADGPNTTDDAAISYASDLDSRRVYLVDPYVEVLEGGETAYNPASPRACGLLAKSDNDRGFWWSPSNQPISGITGTQRPVDYTHGDANSRANVLNESKVNTIINQDGYRLWGNLTLSSDQKWQFLSVVRTADIINDSILDAHLWAVDRPITKTYLQDVAEGVNNYLAYLRSLGAILGGNCWPDPDLNTTVNIQLGKVYFNLDFTPPYPAQTITFTSILTPDYIETLN
jgi:hypothetical protein